MLWHFDEAVALALYSKDDPDCEAVITYCLPLVNICAKRNAWIFKYEAADVKQEMTIGMIRAIRTYNPVETASLLTWITNNIRYACLDYNKKHRWYLEAFQGFDENVEYLVPSPEDEAIQTETNEVKAKRLYL